MSSHLRLQSSENEMNWEYRDSQEDIYDARDFLNLSPLTTTLPVSLTDTLVPPGSHQIKDRWKQKLLAVRANYGGPGDYFVDEVDAAGSVNL